MTEKSPGESTPEAKTGFLARLKRPPQCSMARMIVIGVLGGILIWGGLNTGMEYTNRTEFCLSCHTMKTPYEELKKTVHYSNRTGTSVGCADCHVASSKEPFDYARKMTQKVFASKDVIGEILGTIDTPEKFEAHRLTMAKRVWAQMKAADSKECRNCHKFDKMDTTKQKDRSVVKHEGAMQDGKTCIDCHKGIAHKPVHHLLEDDASKTATKDTPTASTAPPSAPATIDKPTAPTPAPGSATADLSGTKASAATAAASTVTQVAAAPTETKPSKAEPAAPATSGGSVAAGIDWSKVPSRPIKLFYPGQASFEWVMNKADHSSVTDIIEKKRACARCHSGDANEIGNAIVAGKPVGVSKSVLEPSPPAGKVGFIPVDLQIAHDGNKIYFRYEWVPPKNTGNKADPKNEVKVTLMFDGGGTVPGAEINGCWNTCHTDLRTMKEAADDKKTKYIKGADLASGNFMDLLQYRSGKGEKQVDGWIDSTRHMDGGKTQFKAEGKKEGNKWVVLMERTLAAAGGKGDHAIAPEKTYYFGFAIHEDFSNARYHYVSLGYQFGLDKDDPATKNYINVQKQ